LKFKGEAYLTAFVSFLVMCCTLALTRQAQFPSLDIFAAPLAVLIILCFCNKNSFTLDFLFFFVACSVLACVGLGKGFLSIDALRFFIILTFSLLAFRMKNLKLNWQLAMLPVALQAAFISVVAVYLGIKADYSLGQKVRAFVLERQWGDIYSFDGIYYRVQLKGNALIPGLFLMSLFSIPTEKRISIKIYLILSSAGLVAAGNLNYFIVALVAVGIRIFYLLRYRVWACLGATYIACLSIVLFFDKLIRLISMKFEGDVSSMSVRFDQIDALLRHYYERPLSLIFGEGLGARFPDGQIRQYSNGLYIELQTLYIFYQLGFIVFSLFVFILLRFSLHYLSDRGRVVFYLFIACGLANPYIFDSTQILFTFILVSTSVFGASKLDAAAICSRQGNVVPSVNTAKPDFHLSSTLS